MLTELLLGILVLVLFCGVVNRKPRNLPPGWWGLPVIGRFPSSTHSLSDQVKVVAKEYGKIASWRIGSRIFVFLSDYKCIKNAFAKLEFTDRPDFHTFAVFSDFSSTGVVFSNGQVWQNNRRFALRHLKDLGMGKTRLEEAIQYEAASLVKDFEKCVGHPGPLPWSINVAVLNVIWQLIAGRRYDVENLEVQQFNLLLNSAIQDVQKKIFFFDFLPWLLPILPDFAERWLGIKDASEKMRQIFSYMREHIKEHQDTLDPENPRDFIDAYLLEMEAQKNDADSTMNIEDLTICLSDLFTAGSETTSSTIRWAIYYLAKYPDVQAKVQEEIDSVVPRDVLPSVLQKDSMPYLEAVLLEVHRMVSLLRLGLLHCCSRDTEFEGFTIPKGAVVAANLEGCHRDPVYWEKPHDFYPEHFLDADGKVMTKKEGFLPFSSGRRQCLGESLARMELFVFLSALLQNFSFSAPKDKELVLEKDPMLHIVNLPKSMDVVITKRK